jgi:hypothetical protein
MSESYSYKPSIFRLAIRFAVPGPGLCRVFGVFGVVSASHQPIAQLVYVPLMYTSASSTFGNSRSPVCCK